MRSRRQLAAAVALLAVLAGKTVSASIDSIGASGWHTWRVETGGNSPDWCCHVWNSGNAVRTTCNLDEGRSGYSSSDDRNEVAPHIQIYALMSAGKASKLRALSSQCPVSAQSEIIDLGIVESSDSVSWLARYVAPKSNVSSDALAAMSAHEDSFDAMISVIENRSLDRDIRKQALFWLMESKSERGFAYIERLFARN